jgi:AcrR family transcriptional regulator
LKSRSASPGSIADGAPASGTVTSSPKGSDRQKQILLEAARLFVAKGYDATSMNDIADAVKLTKAGLYHFVRSKEELLFTIMSHSLDRLRADVIVPARAVDDPLERLRVIVRNHALNVGHETLDAGAPISIVVDDAPGLSDENRKTIDARKREYLDLLRDTLVALKAEGRLARHADPTVMAFSIIGMVMWIARWRRPGGSMRQDEVARQIETLVVGGLLKSLRT